MKILEIKESREPCTESGWEAYDFILKDSLSDSDIRRFNSLGDFLYLSMLKQPFFKVEAHHMLIKGILGQCSFRLAVHRDSRQVKERLRTFLETGSEWLL